MQQLLQEQEERDAQLQERVQQLQAQHEAELVRRARAEGGACVLWWEREGGGGGGEHGF
jgi:hypothetical protein